jgi:hypothetical protein
MEQHHHEESIAQNKVHFAMKITVTVWTTTKLTQQFCYFITITSNSKQFINTTDINK